MARALFTTARYASPERRHSIGPCRALRMGQKAANQSCEERGTHFAAFDFRMVFAIIVRLHEIVDLPIYGAPLAHSLAHAEQEHTDLRATRGARR
jgi:hypothetical protein